MNVLVTGGAGYIGSHAAQMLASKGHRIVTYDNLSRGNRHAVKWGPLIVGDIADSSLLQTVFREYRIEAVMHFAAFAYVGESVALPHIYFENNVGRSISLNKAMRESSVRNLVFSSSCATYGIPDSLPITEDNPQRPINPYGESKRQVERIILDPAVGER